MPYAIFNSMELNILKIKSIVMAMRGKNTLSISEHQIQKYFNSIDEAIKKSIKANDKALKYLASR